MKRSKHFWKAATVGCLALMMAIPTLSAGESVSFRSKLSKSSPNLECRSEKGKWLSGDFHQHTYYTDGSTPFDFVMEKNNEYGLDWWANSEHGGSRNRDGNGVFWDTYSPNPIFGDAASSGGHLVMWRWQSLRDFVYPDILDTRALYPNKKIFSGLEWNVPGHEHCSTAIVPKAGDNSAAAISAFEYQFDKSDRDTSRTDEVTPFGVLTKMNGRTLDQKAGKPTGDARHADAVAGCQWMQDQYQAKTIDNGWIIFAHIERAGAFKTGESDGGYNIEHFRDFNNAGPDVCYGFEGAPGHQVNEYRGLGNTVTCVDGICTSADFGGTYGGVGFYTAKVGGLWDALLGEGRRWFNFANSDYHTHYTAGGDDFYPGEYQKTWVYAKNKDWKAKYSLDEIADGLRSGNSYFVHGDLINHLEFEAQDGWKQATMGEELKSHGKIRNLKLTIKFKGPMTNNCGSSDASLECTRPMVDHIDLIAGEISGKVSPTLPNGDPNPEYTKNTNETTKVIASFTDYDWKVDRDGTHTIVYHIKDVKKDMYFRLRGTNLACGTPNETGPAAGLGTANYCNPLPDALTAPNTAQKAWDDLWFYSNPIFVYVK